jgi:hypothetical protein
MLSLALAPIAFAPPERIAASDLVATLPGWDKPLPSKMYSGYINVTASTDREMHVHYLFVESESEPDTDPVLLWTNGGPGASSMFGLFVELGPLLANGDSLKTAAYNKTGVPSLSSTLTPTPYPTPTPKLTRRALALFYPNPNPISNPDPEANQACPRSFTTRTAGRASARSSCLTGRRRSASPTALTRPVTARAAGTGMIRAWPP